MALLTTQIAESSAPYDSLRLRVYDCAVTADGQTFTLADAQSGSTSTAVTDTDLAAPTSRVKVGIRDVVAAWPGPSTSSGTMTFSTGGAALASLYVWSPGGISLAVGTASTAPLRKVESGAPSDSTTTWCRGKDYLRYRHVILRFPSVATGDTFVCEGVKDYCFENESTTELCSLSYVVATGTFTFTITSGPITDLKLHMWLGR